jgi:hypothetical protein
MPTLNSNIVFNLPVTKSFLQQYAIVHHQFGLSYRGIKYSLETLFDVKRSIGWVYNVLHDASQKAKELNYQEDLSEIKISANDELYDGNKPILTSVCTNSLYCPLLKKTPNRSADTWAKELTELSHKLYVPSSVILDGLNSLHAGHLRAFEDINIIYDTFHIIKDLNDLKRFANHRLRSSKTNLEAILTKLKKAKDEKKIKLLNAQEKVAEASYHKALILHKDIAILNSWMQHDILVVAGYDYQTRLNLLSFIADEFEILEPQMEHRIKPIRRTLQKKADKLLGFVKELENDLTLYANEIGCSVYWLWQICYSERYSQNHSKYYQFIEHIKNGLKHKYYKVHQAVIAIMGEVEKASSVVENLNGRIRKFLQNHIHVSQDILDLFRFIINHKEFERSRCEHRKGKSPSEVLHGKAHKHWLELLGFELFKQAA